MCTKVEVLGIFIALECQTWLWQGLSENWRHKHQYKNKENQNQLNKNVGKLDFFFILVKVWSCKYWCQIEEDI